MLKNIDQQQCLNLLIGIAVIYSMYCLSGIAHEQLIKNPFYNHRTQKEDPPINCPEGLVFFPYLVTWIGGYIYNKLFIKNRVSIPEKNSLFCALAVFISTFTYTVAIFKTSFPIVIAFKSSNIIPVLLVAIFCTRVKEKKLNLGRKKLIVGIILTIGVLIFNLFDPATHERQTKTQIIGIALLLVSSFADGFLPDFQAEIKSVYKPQPTQMMEKINLWVVIVSFIWMVGSFNLIPFFQYLLEHYLYFTYLFVMSLFNLLGQIYVYRLIKQFKQHVVPFIITTRKIITIVISVLFVGHKKYELIQFVGVFIIFVSVAYEFISQIQKSDQSKPEKFQKVTDWNEIETQRTSLEVVEEEIK